MLENKTHLTIDQCAKTNPILRRNRKLSFTFGPISIVFGTLYFFYEEYSNLTGVLFIVLGLSIIIMSLFSLRLYKKQDSVPDYITYDYRFNDDYVDIETTTNKQTAKIKMDYKDIVKYKYMNNYHYLFINKYVYYIVKEEFNETQREFFLSKVKKKSR